MTKWTAAMVNTAVLFLLALLCGHAHANLASRSEGFLGDFGLGRESTWGTAVAVTDYLELMSENITTGIDRFDTRNIYAGRWEPDDSDGARRTTGTVVHAAHPVSVGHLLKAVFGQASASVVLSGFLWTMNHTTPTTGFADGVPRQPYTLEMFRDVGSSHRYAGALANKLEMTVAPNQALMVTVEWLAKARTLLSRTTPTFPASSATPFTFDACSISIGGAATARLESFGLSIDNQLEGILALNNSNEIARIREQGPQLIRVQGTLDFIDVTEEQDFINQTERAVTVNLFKGQSFNILMDIPRMVYTAFPVGTAGRGRNTVQFEGRARYLASSGTAIGIRLTTIKSNY